MTQRHLRGKRFLAALSPLLALAALGCSTLVPPAREAVLGVLAISNLAIDPIELEDADAEGRDWFREVLAYQATATARRASLEQQLAHALNSPSGMTGNWQLSGHVSVPVALPPNLRGSRAAFQEGDLAVARLELLDDKRDRVATAQVNVPWRKVRWTIGAKMRRARRTDAALLDAVELAVKRAVRQLVLQLHTTAQSEEALGLSAKSPGEASVSPALSMPIVRERGSHDD